MLFLVVVENDITAKVHEIDAFFRQPSQTNDNNNNREENFERTKTSRMVSSMCRRRR